MKTLFFGTSAFAVPSLRVVAARTELAGVVTQPDRPAGRGHRLTPSPVKSAALELGSRVYEPVRLRAFARRNRRAEFDLFVLASYGRILPAELLELPRLGALNVHPSLLPKYRGATPIQTAIANGDMETGVSIMLMDADSTPATIVLAKRVAIEPGETYGELHERLACVRRGVAGEALDRAQRGELSHYPQRGERDCDAPNLQRRSRARPGACRRSESSTRCALFRRSPAARAMLAGEIVKVLRAHVAPDGTLAIDELIAPNRGRMTGDEYLRMRRGLSS